MEKLYLNINNRETLCQGYPSIKFKYSASQANCVVKKSLQLFNSSDKITEVMFKPPMTKYFKIMNKATLVKQVINPQSYIDIELAFEPYETRHYYDCFSFDHGSVDNKDTKIKLTAEPVFDVLKQIPSHIAFGNVFLGTTKEHELLFHALSTKDVVFYFVLKNWSDFRAEPDQGVLSSNSASPVEIKISFTGLKLGSARTDLLLFLPTLCETPFPIVLTAQTLERFPPTLSNNYKENTETQDSSLKNVNNYYSRLLWLNSESYCNASKNAIIYKIMNHNFLLEVKNCQELQGKIKSTKGNSNFKSHESIWKESHELNQMETQKNTKKIINVLGDGSVPSAENYGSICTEETTNFLRSQSLLKFVQAVCRVMESNRMKGRLATLKSEISHQASHTSGFQ